MNSNLIIFDTYTDGYTVSANAGPSVIGITISTFYSSGSQVGRIIDADIIFNDDAYNFTLDQPSDLGQDLVNLQDVATSRDRPPSGAGSYIHRRRHHVALCPYRSEYDPCR